MDAVRKAQEEERERLNTVEMQEKENHSGMFVNRWNEQIDMVIYENKSDFAEANLMRK